MKRTLFYTLLCAILSGITACSQKDDVETNPDGKVDLAKGLQIKLNFTDYNEDIKVDGTRAVTNDTLRREWVDLGNGISAEVTVKRDTTKSKAKASTRAIADGTYTLLAYDHTTHNLVGEITGQVVSGTFTPSAGFDVEPNKTYDFVCYNSKVTRNGNMLTVTKANAEHARIGRNTLTIYPSFSRQYITFNMKPAASRLYILLESWVDFPALTATLATAAGQTVPSAAQYDMSTDTWTTGTGVANSENLTFPAGMIPPYSYYDDALSNSQYLYYLPSTDIGKLKLTLHGSGKIYNLPLEGANLLLNSLKDGAGLVTTMQPTYSYAVSVKLVYNYIYLMSDGSTDFINSTQYTALRADDGKTPRYMDKRGNVLNTPKVPIAVVVSQSRGMAVALKDAGGGAKYPWVGKMSLQSKAVNKSYVIDPEIFDLLALENGYSETWDASASTDNTTVKGSSNDFPAFKAAGDYQPGVSVTGTMVGRKWYLPAFGEWKYVFSALGFGDVTKVKRYDLYPWNVALADIAFTQVGGTALYRNYDNYVSSSEYQIYSWEHGPQHVGVIWNHSYSGFLWTGMEKRFAGRVRPFIKYK